MLFWRFKSRPSETGDLNIALTYQQIIAATKLDHHARQMAIKGEPPLEQKGSAVEEHDAIDLVGRRIIARNAELDAQSVALAQQIQALTSNSSFDPAVHHHLVVDALTASVTARAPAIRDALALVKTRAAEWAAFRDEQKIARPADYPKSKLVHFRWVGVTIGGETIAESTLLMPATPDGILGATGIALGISLVTTGLGLFIGFGALRYMAAFRASLRAASWIALLPLVSLLGLVSLYVAHYRHVAGIADDTPSDTQVIDHLLAQPFDLTGPGWLLLFLSLACAGFATWKGYTASDPIPGYEKVDRAYVDARNDRDYLHSDLQAGIAALNSSTVKPVFDQPKLARLKRDHLLNTYADLESKHQRAALLAEQEAALVLRSIDDCRRLNLAIRADGVTPASFAQLPEISAKVSAIPAGLKDRLEVATAAAIGDATKASEQALQMARILGQTSDRATEIMASLERADPRNGDSPVSDLRATLEANLAAAALPNPNAKPALAAPAAEQP